MAYINFNARYNKWRVQIQQDGERKSRSFDSELEAKQWAEATESLVKRRRMARALCLKEDGENAHLMTAVPSKVLRAIAEVPYDGATIVDAAIPYTDLAGIYFLIVNMEVKYVGQSVDVLKRISRHMTDGRKFDSFSFISCPRERLDELERLYITALLPDWNLHLGGRSASGLGLGKRERRRSTRAVSAAKNQALGPESRGAS